MLCFLKRILPFTLTLAIGSAVGGFFNLFGSSNTKPAASPAPPVRAESSYGRKSSCNMRARNFSSSIKSAEVVSKPEAVYTEAARRNKTEGDVTLRVMLGADGTVRDVETITSLPDGLTEQARKAAKGIRFNPATRDGAPVDESKVITYSFTLD